jgi:hypothetical protein
VNELFPYSEHKKSGIPLTEWIAERVADLLDRDPELLFSYLYRLDVPESSVDQVIRTGGEEVAYQLAELILRRQEQRQQTKKNVVVPKDIDTMGLDW